MSSSPEPDGAACGDGSNAGGYWAVSRSPLVFGILQYTDDGLGRETVADGVAAGTLFAFLGYRTGALAGVATVGLDLPKGSH